MKLFNEGFRTQYAFAEAIQHIIDKINILEEDVQEISEFFEKYNERFLNMTKRLNKLEILGQYMDENLDGSTEEGYILYDKENNKIITKLLSQINKMHASQDLLKNITEEDFLKQQAKRRKNDKKYIKEHLSEILGKTNVQKTMD